MIFFMNDKKCKYFDIFHKKLNFLIHSAVVMMASYFFYSFKSNRESYSFLKIIFDSRIYKMKRSCCKLML